MYFVHFGHPHYRSLLSLYLRVCQNKVSSSVTQHLSTIGNKRLLIEGLCSISSFLEMRVNMLAYIVLIHKSTLSAVPECAYRYKKQGIGITSTYQTIQLPIDSITSTVPYNEQFVERDLAKNSTKCTWSIQCASLLTKYQGLPFRMACKLSMTASENQRVYNTY